MFSCSHFSPNNNTQTMSKRLMQEEKPGEVVALRLLASKMDPRGRGAKRTRACTCGIVRKGCPSCPYCSAVVLVQEALARWRGARDSPEAKLVFLFGHRKIPLGLREKEKCISALRADVKRIALRLRQQGSEFLHLRLCLVTLSGGRVLSSSHALGGRRQMFSDWADGSQRQSLVTLRRLQKKTQIHTWTRSLGTLSGRRWQMQLAKLGQLETSVQEVAKQAKWTSGRLGGLAGALDEINGIIPLVGVPNVKTNCLHVAGSYSGSPGSWKTVCGWCWVNTGKVAKPLTVGLCPSAKVSLCTSCKTGYDHLPNGWLALAQVGSSRADRPQRGVYGG